MNWSSIALDFASFLAPVIATILTIVGVALANKLLKKMGVERSKKVDDMVDKYVVMAVNAIEQIALKKLDRRELDNRSKLGLAINTVLEELKQSGIRDVGEDLVRHRIEAYIYGENLKKTGNGDLTKPLHT